MIPFLFLFSLVNDVRTLIAHRDMASAERAVRTYQQQAGNTSEVAAAVSWIARGALDNKQFDEADAKAAEARKMSQALLSSRRLDVDPWLQMALGASIEVHAQVLAAKGERAEAVAFLREQFELYRSTPIGERVRKNLNLLSLEGKPAPPLETADWIGAKPPSLADLRGHPVLLFFWAHWCSDCKAEEKVIASIMRTYGPKGLVLVAPTRLYGYVAGGEEAPAATEKRYAERVWQQFYPDLVQAPVPLSAANFLNYGCSSTPTLALLDGRGVVRFYHPGAVSEPELASRIEKLLSRTQTGR